LRAGNKGTRELEAGGRERASEWSVARADFGGLRQHQLGSFLGWEVWRCKPQNLRGFWRRHGVFCAWKWGGAQRKLRLAGGNAMVFRGRVHHLRPIFLEVRERVRINIGFCTARGRNRRVRIESNLGLKCGSFDSVRSGGLGSGRQADC
jgi:hypothetical protein